MACGVSRQRAKDVELHIGIVEPAHVQMRRRPRLPRKPDSLVAGAQRRDLLELSLCMVWPRGGEEVVRNFVVGGGQAIEQREDVALVTHVTGKISSQYQTAIQ